jgi:hypothetical protein
MRSQRQVRSGGSASNERTTSSTYEIAAHRVLVSGRDGVWNVNLDEKTLPNTFPTEAEAWEAAVREADRLDRLAGRGSPPARAAGSR